MMDNLVSALNKLYTNTLIRALEKLAANSFEGHKGRPGERGGSLPRGQSAPMKADFKEIVYRTAEKLGYPRNKIVALESEGKPFMVGNQHFTTAGEYSPQTGEVFIFDVDTLDEEQITGIMAHEIQHDRWTRFNKIADQQTDEVAASLDLPKSKRIINPEGRFVRESDKEKYWAYDLKSNYISDENWSHLRKTDGVTNYSRAYWDAWNSGQELTDRAVDETLAEIARIDALQEFGGYAGVNYADVDPIWKEVYTRMKNV